MSNETKIYPEQENPPRPTYAANLRGHPVAGWLQYATTNGNPDNGAITINVTIDGEKAKTEEFLFTSAEERSKARTQAKNVWRSAVLAVLAAV